MKTLHQKETELKNAFLFYGLNNIQDQIYLELYIRQKGKAYAFNQIEFDSQKLISEENDNRYHLIIEKYKEFINLYSDNDSQIDNMYQFCLQFCNEIFNS